MARLASLDDPAPRPAETDPTDPRQKFSMRSTNVDRFLGRCPFAWSERRQPTYRGLAQRGERSGFIRVGSPAAADPQRAGNNLAFGLSNIHSDRQDD